MELFAIGICALCAVLFAALVQKTNKEYALLISLGTAAVLLLFLLERAGPVLQQVEDLAFGKREGSQIIEGSPGDSQRVYAWMGVKPFVLDADDRIQIDLGQLIHRCIVWSGLDLRSHFRHWLFCKRLPIKGVPIIDQHSGRDQCKQDCWQQDPFQTESKHAFHSDRLLSVFIIDQTGTVHHRFGLRSPRIILHL